MYAGGSYGSYDYYYAADEPGVSYMGPMREHELHKLTYNVNVDNGGNPNTFTAKIQLNDGMRRTCSTATKWNSDSDLTRVGPFYICMAEILLDEIYSNPFFQVYEDINEIPGKGRTDLIYDLKKMEKGRVKGEDMRGLPIYESARDQLAEKIKADTPIGEFSTGSGTKYNSWGMSVKLFEYMQYVDDITILTYSSHVRVGAEAQFQVVIAETFSSYGKIIKVNDLDFNPFLYLDRYDYPTGPWTTAYMAAPDKKNYIDTNLPSSTIPLDHRTYLSRPDNLDPADYPIGNDDLIYIHNIDEYPIDQPDYDKIIDHNIRLNTQGRENFIFDAWFHVDKINFNWASASTGKDQYMYAMSEGLHELIKNTDYKRYRGSSEIFPKSNAIEPISSKTYRELYKDATGDADKIKIIAKNVKERINALVAAGDSDDDALQYMLNAQKTRIKFVDLKHSRSGVMYSKNTYLENGNTSYYDGSGNKLSDHYINDAAKPLMTGPVMFSIVIAAIKYNSKTLPVYVESLAGCDVLPAPYTTYFHGDNIAPTVQDKIKEIWLKKGADKEPFIEQLYADNKSSADETTKLILTNFRKKKYCNTQYYHLPPYDASMHQTATKYNDMLDYVVSLNTRGRDYVYDNYSVDIFEDSPLSSDKEGELYDALGMWIESRLEASDTSVVESTVALLPTREAVIRSWSTANTVDEYAVAEDLRVYIRDKLRTSPFVYLQNDKIKFFDHAGTEHELLRTISDDILGGTIGVELTVFRNNTDQIPADEHIMPPFCATRGYKRSSSRILHIALINKKFFILKSPKNYNFIDYETMSVDKIEVINSVICKRDKTNVTAEISNFFTTKTDIYWSSKKPFYGLGIVPVPPTPTPSTPPTQPATINPIVHCRITDGAVNATGENRYALNDPELKVLCNMVLHMLKTL